MELDERKLDEILEITRENNKILSGMRRTQRWSSFFRIVYWGVIFMSIFGTYYYFQPTIRKYVGVLQSSMSVIQKFQNTAGSIPTDIQAVKNLIGQ